MKILWNSKIIMFAPRSCVMVALLMCAASFERFLFSSSGTCYEQLRQASWSSQLATAIHAYAAALSSDF